MTEERQCDECCYEEWHNGDRSKCNFLTNDYRCLIEEARTYES